ncbi:MAG: sulfur carrier protein ThiS [Actinomycetota bacterium]|jgi:sulfur carrier protein
MRINGQIHDLEPLSVVELLALRQFPSRGIAVAVNGEIVRRGEWDSLVVGVEDEVEILTAAAGG